MASYTIVPRDGTPLTVPDNVTLTVDQLLIMGDLTTDWNETYNKNFVTLDKKIYANENDLLTKVNSSDLGVYADFTTAIDANK